MIPKLMTHRSGNTLLEYGLVGSLLLLVCIAGFLAVGNNLGDFFGGLKTDMAAHKQVASVAQVSKAPVTAGVLEQIATDKPPSMVTNDEGAQDLVLLQKDLSTKLQTLGANGTTELLSKQLEVLAKQLLEQGKISQAESDAIMRLANQGHHMANMESLIEDAVRIADGDMSKFKQVSFNLDGQTYLASKLAANLGFSRWKPDVFANLDVLTAYPENAQPEMAKLRQLYQETLSIKAMSDPAVRATIQSAATQIAMIAEGIEDNVWDVDIYPITSVEDLNNKLASSSTQMNSSKICQAGDFQDNGVVCSK